MLSDATSSRKRYLTLYDWRLSFLCESNKVSSKGALQHPRVTTTAYSHRRSGMSLCTETGQAYLYRKSYTAMKRPESGWASISPCAASAASAVITAMLDPSRWVHRDPRVRGWCGDERPSCRSQQRGTARAASDELKWPGCNSLVSRNLRKQPTACTGATGCRPQGHSVPHRHVRDMQQADQGYTIRRRPHCTRCVGSVGSAEAGEPRTRLSNKAWTTAESKKLHSQVRSPTLARDQGRPVVCVSGEK